MWAKGPQPGARPKDSFLTEYPGATCQRKHHAHDISAYVVHLADGTFVVGRGNAQQAWTEAYSVMRRREERVQAPANKKPKDKSTLTMRS
jgi:hypothetical protein